MHSRCRLGGLLTPHQIEVLKPLFELHQQVGSLKLWRPKDLGAYRHSHHTKTLSSLEQQGLVEREPLSQGERAQYGYRITLEGYKTYEAFRTLINVPLDAILGSGVDRLRAQRAYQMAA